ncbi:AraC family transcriptional regulator [Providencia alcalifaciens]|uniref:AraC family transcriptional regulator n=1 Tax=Providencia alcalifaciens TaxID=126385 RepID=UPI0015D08840|nr:AraC family transcriptional regulator [Providencia alcalifaciens]MBF0693357.1 AraC family transcriptional regulator [Providencia alcalifaciens]NYS91861.1 AraC family transcriptional regulator [Providencia alcalifaciens]
MEYIKNHKVNMKVRLYNAALVYTNECSLTVSSENETIIIPENTIIFFERNIRFNVLITKNDTSKYMEIITIDNDVLSKIIKVMDPLYDFNSIQLTEKRGLLQKTFIISGGDISLSLFKSIKELEICNKTIYKLACLFSSVPDESAMFSSLCISASISFSDNIRKTISNNLEKKWKLSDISKEVNISEITIRKRLENEGLTFQQLLLDVRMNYAARLLLDSDIYIENVSRRIGISSSSYFIKLFSQYYGITPKQFYLYHKSQCRGLRY